MIRGAREEGLTVGRLCSDTDKTSLLEEANEDGHIIIVANTNALFVSTNLEGLISDHADDWCV